MIYHCGIITSVRGGGVNPPKWQEGSEILLIAYCVACIANIGSTMKNNFQKLSNYFVVRNTPLKFYQGENLPMNNGILRLNGFTRN